MNYNREFLVPYLENICALYFAQAKVRNKAVWYDQEAQQIENGKYPIKRYPDEPYTRHVKNSSDVFRGSLYLFFGFFFLLSEDFWLFGLGLIGIGACFIIGYYSEKSDVENDNQKAWEEYDMKVNKIEQENKVAQKKNDQERENLPALYEKLDFYFNEDDEIERLLNELYSANVIPLQYRNMYAAVYLYDYFRSSPFNDLEKALTLFVLEEIKARLDVIIQQQSEIILNQRIMMANQRTMIGNQKKTYWELQEFHNEMTDKVDKLVANDEEKKAYLQMIEADASATAYFAAATYLKY